MGSRRRHAPYRRVIAEGRIARASNRFEFASDGKRFYFTVEDRQSDIWVAEVAVR